MKEEEREKEEKAKRSEEYTQCYVVFHHSLFSDFLPEESRKLITMLD
jgi:hypothetical protein